MFRTGFIKSSKYHLPNYWDLIKKNQIALDPDLPSYFKKIMNTEHPLFSVYYSRLTRSSGSRGGRLRKGNYDLANMSEGRVRCERKNRAAAIFQFL